MTIATIVSTTPSRKLLIIAAPPSAIAVVTFSRHGRRMTSQRSSAAEQRRQLIELCTVAVERLRSLNGVPAGSVPVPPLQRLTHGGNRLGTVAGQRTWRLHHVPVPGAARQARLIEEALLHRSHQLIDPPQLAGGNRKSPGHARSVGRLISLHALPQAFCGCIQRGKIDAWHVGQTLGRADWTGRVARETVCIGSEQLVLVLGGLALAVDFLMQLREIAVQTGTEVTEAQRQDLRIGCPHHDVTGHLGERNLVLEGWIAETDEVIERIIAGMIDTGIVVLTAKENVECGDTEMIQEGAEVRPGAQGIERDIAALGGQGRELLGVRIGARLSSLDLHERPLTLLDADMGFRVGHTGCYLIDQVLQR